MPERFIGVDEYPHQHGVGGHQHHQHQHQHQHQQQQMVPMSGGAPYPTMPMVRVADASGQDMLVPLGQWEQMQQQSMGAPVGPGGAMGGMGKWVVLIGLGLVGWWAYKKFNKGKETEFFGERKSRRSGSHMMKEFEQFLKARERSSSDDERYED